MDYFKKLPEEISLDILTRLPTESVLDSKLVCTNWRSVVAHPSFYKMHFHHHLNHPSDESGKLGFLVLTPCTIYGVRLHYFDYNQNHDESTNPIQRITRVNFTSPFKYFTIVGSCNGLICLLPDPEPQRHPSVCICNPITREYLMLPNIKRESDTDGYIYETTSFGYVSSTNEYKIVSFYKFKTCLEVHIYTLGSGNGWRNLGRFNYASESLYLKHQVFFANGALYWLDHELKIIGTFDLGNEKFCQHLSPPPLPPYTHRFRCRMGVLDGFLFLAVDNQINGLSDIWFLKEMEDLSLGWNNEFRIQDMDSMDLFSVTKSDGVLTKRNYYFCINIYDTNTSSSKSLVKFKSRILQVCSHKNTLVSLKELGEVAVEVMESIQIEETKSGEQPQEDADPEYIYM